MINNCNFRKVNILNINVACVDVTDLLSLIEKWSLEEIKRTITYVNAYCFSITRNDPEFCEILLESDLTYSDGISVVWAASLLNGCSLHKITGADWIDDFCFLATQKQLRIYILAGKSGIAEEAAKRLRIRFPNIQIVGTCDGYFYERSEEIILNEIEAQRPHIVFIGMGTPTQEKWIHANREKINAPVCWAVGALFDYVAGIEPRVPNWMNAIALEWFWRWMMDPIGKFKRYAIGNPEFIIRVLYQRLRLRKTTVK
jgi:N-acetylglucosaminyldiphosphoundecaprenol N-acetyl-beta-D-mannosaminyltransferase